MLNFTGGIGGLNFECDMICEYTVADNAMTIEGVEGMRAWRELEPRFRPFASAGAAAPVVAIDVREVDVLPDADVRWTYEPEYDGVGFITARAATLPDGDVLMEFSHVEESKPRLRMRINDAHDRAEVVMRHGGDGCDKYFLTHAIMLAYVMATSGNGTLMIHASVVMHVPSPSTCIEPPSRIKLPRSYISFSYRSHSFLAILSSRSHGKYSPSTSPPHALNPQFIPRISLPSVTNVGA